MCGIATVVGESNDTNEDLMRDMLDSIHHRGPDEYDIIETPYCLLGHKRLSIIGPGDGIQPIPNENEDAWIICNGEIYNYKKIREKHLTDHTMRRDSDSEIILHLYEEYGASVVDYLDGMFSFIIADYRGDIPKVFAARDPLGIKPLYYGKKDGFYFFASELKSLYKVVDEVKEFPEGHYFTLETGFVAYRTIKTPSSNKDLDKDSEKEAILKGIKDLLEKAVRKRLMSDVPLGVLLSGGLDSSLISAIANKYHDGDQPLKSFCVGLSGSSDIKAAREVAKYIGTDHYEYVYSEQELWEAIPRVIYHLESFEPSLVRSAIPCYFVSKLAANHVKVVLSGEGADELFSGYEYLKDIEDEKKLDQELIRVLKSLHNINLQRLDRMSMAHSLEGRVPFLDEVLINYSLRIPSSLKIYNNNRDKKIEKWILRKAFEDEGYLPNHILWRDKEEFSEGSGARDLLEVRLEKSISDLELYQEKKRILKEDGFKIRSKQELYFYRIFKTFYPKPSTLDTIGRWATS